MSLMLLGHVDLADGDNTRAQALLAEAASLFQATGNLMYLPWCLEGLAGLAAAQGDYERAAELDGARDALRAQIGVFLPPVHPAGYDADAGRGPRRPYPGSVRRGPGQASRPAAAADHRGSHKQLELAARSQPGSDRARTGGSACAARRHNTTLAAPIRQGDCG